MKKSQIIIVSLLVVVVMGFTGYNYVMHGGARDLATEAANYTVTSQEITKEFSANTEVANKKYLEKAVAIKGTITSIKGNEVIVDNTIICTLKEKLNPSIKENQLITLKGRVVGFDDLMGEIKLDQCLAI